MKRISFSIIATAVLLAASVSVSSASANGKLDEILANMQREGSKINTFYAKMEQESFELGAKATYRAVIFFQHKGKDDKVRISYTKPDGQTVWVNGDQITLYQARIKQAVKTTRRKQASQKPELSFIASPYNSVPQLKSQYTVVYLGDENGLAKLELTPKASSSMKKAIIWVDQSMWLPIKYQVFAANGDVSSITLSDLKTNGSIPDKVFEPQFPKDTKVVNQ